MTLKKRLFCPFLEQKEHMFIGKRTYVRWQSKLTPLEKSVNFIGKVSYLCENFYLFLCGMTSN